MKIMKFISHMLMMVLALSTLSLAGDSARKIERDSNGALSQFYHEVKGSEEYLQNVKAYLVFPDVNEGGFFLGGKYGEGVLRIKGKTKAFYSITGLSAGFQAGIQNYALIIAVTSENALNKLLIDDDWDTEMDVNIAMAEWNSDEELDDVDFGSDLVGFVFDSKGMMGNFSFEGTKFERIHPSGSHSPAY
jgi:lipid-binding SYLF domain-containing protein